MLTPEQIKARDNKLTASRVGVLMSGDETKILSLWNEMLGLEEPEDLSGVWPVRLGEATEALNLDWYARKHGPVTRMGEVVIGNPDWMACTLDGFDAHRECPVECKCTGGREPLEVIIGRYTPQCTWQMMITKSQECALSVIMGGAEPVVEYLPFDETYAKELMTRASAFMLCLQTLTPPVALPKVEPPLPPFVEYNMDKNNAWANYAIVWLRSKGEAEQNALATKELKALVPQDGRRAYGHGIEIKRNRAGALSLREMRL